MENKFRRGPYIESGQYVAMILACRAASRPDLSPTAIYMSCLVAKKTLLEIFDDSRVKPANWKNILATAQRPTDTGLVTSAGETIYDLDPQADELKAVAGPAGLDAKEINASALPPNMRWIVEQEWSAARIA